MKKVYIAGPMTGLPEFHKPAFFAMEDELKRRGCIVMNPAILPDGFEWEEYMHICIPMLACCDTVVFWMVGNFRKGLDWNTTKRSRWVSSWLPSRCLIKGLRQSRD